MADNGSRLRAIETRYNGYRFRSRLEARWAVFFDAMGVPYQYEVEGFQLGGVRYLPDFWLPQQDIWVEIKPGGSEPDARHTRFASALEQLRDERYWHMVRGLELPPGHRGNSDPDFILLAGEPFYDGDAWGYTSWRWFGEPNRWWCSEHFMQCPLCQRLILGDAQIGFDPPRDALNCQRCDFDGPPLGTDALGEFHKGMVIANVPNYLHLSPQLRLAYSAARSARFEHGERGY